MRFQLFAARLGFFALVLAALAALAAVGGVRLALMPFSGGIAMMTLASGLGLAALGSALAWLFSALRRNSGEGRRIGLIALIGSMVLLWPPLHSEYLELTSPAIHDATTDPEDPPQFVALAKLRRPGMNSPVYDGSGQIHFQGETNTADYMLHTYYPDLTHPYAVFVVQPKMFWRAFEAAKDMGWQILDYSPKDGRIEAKVPSFWFGQISDVVIRVREGGTLGARLDVRSQSETGSRDFGGNIQRVKDYLAALRARG